MVYVGTFILFILILVVLTFRKNSKEESISLNYYKYQSKKLMTENEFEFFQRLILAFPEYYIFPQVAMGAVLDLIQEENKSVFAGRNTFNKKIIDYIIYDKEKKILAIVELDDKTHDSQKDEKRDDMLLQAGYKILRFQSKRKPSVEELKKIKF